MTSMEEGDKRVEKMMQMVPADWDQRPLILAQELRNLLKPLVDEGTLIDSGGTNGSADLWAKVDGVEYYIHIRKSNNQLKKEGQQVPG